MSEPQPAGALKAQALEIGFDAVGVCDAVPSPGLEAYRRWLDRGFHGSMEYLARHLAQKSDPRSQLPSVQSVIAVTLVYNQPDLWRPGMPRVARYALGRDYHKVLRGKLWRLERWLAVQYPGIETRACVDSAPILERDYAHFAGLGWFGKNTLLIDSRRGSWFFIGLLLSSVQFEPDASSEGSCGKCRKCVEACPTGAIVFEDARWQVDARRCISYLTIEHRGEIDAELRRKMGEWTFGCDVCQEVCPFNEARDSQPDRAPMTRESGFLERREWPDLEALAQVSEAEWDLLTRGSAVRRARWEGLKRNAAINAANARVTTSEREA